MDTLATKRRRVDAALSDVERLAALNELSAALYEYDSNEAVEVADEALRLAREWGNSLGQAWAMHNRGWAYSSLGRLDEALDDQLSARAHFELEGDMKGVANALMAIGDLYGDVGDSATALEYLERAAAPLKLVNDELGMGLLTNLTGIALSHEGRHQEALDIFEQAEAALIVLSQTYLAHMADQSGNIAREIQTMTRRVQAAELSVRVISLEPPEMIADALAWQTLGLEGPPIAASLAQYDDTRLSAVIEREVEALRRNLENLGEAL